MGVGPGAPDLLTLRAARLIENCPVIAYPCAQGLEPLARSIAKAHLRPSQIEIPMVMPMVANRFPACEVYETAAHDIRQHLHAGRDVAVLCEGDSLLYGSFMYLLERLRDVPCEVVPGVSSIFAGAAAAQFPLVSRNETLAVVSGVLDNDRLGAHIRSVEALVILKVGKHFARIKALLTQMGLLATSMYVERASLENQILHPLGDAKGTAPYFSMILVRKAAVV